MQKTDSERYSSGIAELDRVLGGGIIKDSFVVISAQPGAEKSTLLLQVCNFVALSGKKVLYLSGEESESQVKARAERILPTISENIILKSDTSLSRIKEYITLLDPDLVIVDSIQTVVLEEFLPSRAGGAVQVVQCANELMTIAKGDKKAVFIVGHITKNNELAGVKTLEHMVDTLIYIEGNRRYQLRTVSALKNRYGSTDETGLFQMEEGGLVPINNPSEFFVSHNKESEIGSAKTICMNGTRPFVVEIEALVVSNKYSAPMRVGEGINRQELQVLTAILEKRAKLALGNKDVYVKVLGGIKLNEPAVDLGVMTAIASSCKDIPIPSSHVFLGEVGLTGDIKPVPQVEKRLKELDNLGFKKAFIPKNSCKKELSFNNLLIVELQNVQDLMQEISPKKKTA